MNRPVPRHPLRRSGVMAIAGLLLAAGLAVAGVAVAGVAVAGVAGAATTPSGPPAGGAGRGSFPGASGSVAAISGSSMEVQNPQSGQVTVSWSSTTTFSQTATVAASAVTAGDCVTVTGTSSKGIITARSVSISQPTSGTCTGGFGGGTGSGTGGGFGGGAGGARFGGGQRPSGASGAGGFRPPNGGSGQRPSGASGGSGRFAGAGNIGFASGKVTSVTAKSLVISGFSSASIAKAAKGAKPTKKSTKTSSKKPPAVKPTTVKVTVGSSTAYTESQAAAASNLAVGDCVTAAGTSDSTGAVTATTVRITSTGGASCTAGFGGFRGGPTGG